MQLFYQVFAGWIRTKFQIFISWRQAEVVSYTLFWIFARDMGSYTLLVFYIHWAVRPSRYRALTGNLSPYPQLSLIKNCIIFECPNFNINHHSDLCFCLQVIWADILGQGNQSNCMISQNISIQYTIFQYHGFGCQSISISPKQET